LDRIAQVEPASNLALAGNPSKNRVEDARLEPSHNETAPLFGIEPVFGLCYRQLIIPVMEVCWMLTSRDQLLTSHDEFRKLAQEHSQYSQRLDSLTQKRYLSEDEKLEEVRLKKLKLRLKDQMESIERQFRQEYGVNVA
jgi:uncharacterized protein YdcH (DUF465 family)